MSYFRVAVARGREELVLLIAVGAGGSGPGSTALQVAPEDLVAAAQSSESAAVEAQNRLSEHAQDLIIGAAGADAVPGNVAGWLTANGNGPMGAVGAVQSAMINPCGAANQTRTTAAACGPGDDAIVGDASIVAGSARGVRL